MKNNKGFSLIEILATMVILGIVSTVGIVSVNRMINNSRQHYYESQEQQMVLAAQSYVNDNRNILPKNVGGIKKIYLSTLREKNYLKEDIVDQNKEVCYQDKSYVTVYKSNQSEYKYSGYLECPACKQNGGTSCYGADNRKKPVIDITLTKLNGNQGDRLFQDSSTIKITAKSISEPTDHPEIKIASYSYKIYVDNVLKYDSGTKIDNKRYTLEITELLKKYVPGKIKVVATVTNTDGSTTSKTATENYSDLQLPSCGKISYEGAHPLQAYDSQSNNKPVCGSSGNAWINGGSRNAWIVCNDTNELGCAQHEFSQVFTSEGEKDNITIRDRSGKTETCQINKCIDLTTTQVTINVYKRKSGGGKDGGAKQSVTVDKIKTANTSVDREYSGWVNGIDYPNGVIIEVVLKDSLSNVKSLTWKENVANQKDSNNLNANQTVTPKSSDNLGTSQNYTATHDITTEGVRKEVITVVDTAGNKITVNYKIRIDFTKPTCSINGHKSKSKTNESESNDNYSSDHWSGRAKVYTWPTCSDSISGCNPSSYNVKVTRGTGSSATTGTFTQTKRGLESQGVSYHDWNIKDVAGNSTDCSKFKIKLDRTDPVIHFKVTSSGGTINGKYKNNVHIEVSCSDSHSGVNGFSIGGASASNPSKYSRSSRGTLSKSATCKDNVGNSSSKSGSYTVVKYGQSCSKCGCAQRNSCEASVCGYLSCRDGYRVEDGRGCSYSGRDSCCGPGGYWTDCYCRKYASCVNDSCSCKTCDSCWY